MRGLILLGQVLTSTDVVNYIYIYLWLNDVISLMISKRERVLCHGVFWCPLQSLLHQWSHLEETSIMKHSASDWGCRVSRLTQRVPVAVNYAL